MKGLSSFGIILGGLAYVGLVGPASGNELSELLARQSQASSICRDRADGTGQRACLEQQEIANELSNLGYCYGDGVRPMSAAKWQPCSELQVIRTKIINSMTEYEFDGITAKLTIFLGLVDEAGGAMSNDIPDSYPVLIMTCRSAQQDTLTFWLPDGRVQAEGGSAFVALGAFGSLERPDAIGSYVASSEESKGLAVGISISDQAPDVLLSLYNGEEVKIQLNDPANEDHMTFIVLSGGGARLTSVTIGRFHQICELIT